MLARCLRPLTRGALLLALLAGPALAQDFQLEPVGTDATFNVATWNIEHFGHPERGPSDTERQFQYVLAIMRQANVHLWALQEMSHRPSFERLVEALGPGWAGFWQRDQTASGFTGYGFIYRTDFVRIRPWGIQTILHGHEYDFAFRLPLEMRADLTLPGGTIPDVRIINLHAKCCATSEEDWNRRDRASRRLKQYLDNWLAVNTRILVLGDFNDRIVWSIFTARDSPYANFRDDNRYHFGSLSLDQGGVFTFCWNATCSRGSTIDHILITAPLFGYYVWDSTARYDELLTRVPNYVNRPNIPGTVSDHVAVYALFDFFPATSSGDEPVADGFALYSPAPNPFRDQASVNFTLGEPSEVQIEIFDVLGRRVALVEQGPRPAGAHATTVAGHALAPGLYLVRLTAAGPGGTQSATRRALRLP